jgi:hypothetical protein
MNRNENENDENRSENRLLTATTARATATRFGLPRRVDRVIDLIPSAQGGATAQATTAHIAER